MTGDPLADPRIIPTLLAKIGALTVRLEMMAAELEQLRASEDAKPQ